MSVENLSYHKAAGQFLKQHYENNDADHFYFSFGFLSHAAKEAKLIAKSLALEDMDYHNAIVATWFRFAGVTGISGDRTTTSGQEVAAMSDLPFPDQAA